MEWWLDRAAPDVLLLQETKLADGDAPLMAFQMAGYQLVHHGEGRWNGVAIALRDGIAFDEEVTNFGDGPVRNSGAGAKVSLQEEDFNPLDEARMLGGYGSCGRPLCCTTWLQSFEPISIKMAKQQNLSLNPSKLSGMCGRLKCCLRYELPNGKGVVHGGCAEEGGCGSCDNPTGPGGGGG